MADNVGYTPGSGATVAADDIGGVLYQRVKPVVGSDGSATDISGENPMPIAAYGELIEAIEALRMAVQSIQTMLPRMDSALRTKVIAEGTGTFTVSSVTNVTTVSALSNVTSFGGVNALYTSMALSSLSADCLRRNISVS